MKETELTHLNFFSNGRELDNSSGNQTDLWIKMQGKLNYDLAKSEIDLKKNNGLLEQRYWHEQQLLDLRLRYQNYLQMMGCTVYRDSSGRMIYAIMNPQNEVISAKILLSVTGYETINYVSYCPQMYSTLVICWDGCKQNGICFQDLVKGVTPERFLKGLKSNGALFLVSGRAEKKAASALLAYSIQNMQKKELPFQYGWNRMENGDWHFCGQNEIVMQEVIKNAV